jgi:hypothetical protein
VQGNDFYGVQLLSKANARVATNVRGGGGVQTVQDLRANVRGPLFLGPGCEEATTWDDNRGEGGGVEV